LNPYQYLAQVYDDMMRDVDYEAWADYLHTLLQRVSASRILEAACGTGAMSSALHRRGYSVTATDASPNMLVIARESAKKRAKQIRFVHQDMRSLQTGAPVDAVVCACDGVNYLPQPDFPRFAASAFDALRPGGALLFDITTRHKMQHEMDRQVYFDDRDDAACIWQNRYDAQKDALNMDVTIFIREADAFQRFDEHHVQYAHEPGLIEIDLRQAGFEGIQAYEFLTDCPFASSASRIQFFCTKP